MDSTINLLERVYANVATLSAYYYNEHGQFRSDQSEVDPVEFSLWDIEIRIKEVLDQLEDLNDDRKSSGNDTRDMDQGASWDASEWSYDGTVDFPIQGTSSKSSSSKVQQEDGEEAAQVSVRQHWFSPILKQE